VHRYFLGLRQHGAPLVSTFPGQVLFSIMQPRGGSRAQAAPLLIPFNAGGVLARMDLVRTITNAFTSPPPSPGENEVIAPVVFPPLFSGISYGTNWRNGFFFLKVPFPGPYSPLPLPPPLEPLSRSEVAFRGNVSRSLFPQFPPRASI